jgi:hypothetical protein
MYYAPHFFPFKKQSDFLDRFFHKSSISHFTKIRPVGDELTNADRRPDGHEEVDKLSSRLTRMRIKEIKKTFTPTRFGSYRAIFRLNTIMYRQYMAYFSIYNCTQSQDNLLWAQIVWLLYTGMRRITTFRSTTDLTHDGGPKRLYYNTIVLQLPTAFSTVTCSTGL